MSGGDWIGLEHETVLQLEYFRSNWDISGFPGISKFRPSSSATFGQPRRAVTFDKRKNSKLPARTNLRLVFPPTRICHFRARSISKSEGNWITFQWTLKREILTFSILWVHLQRSKRSDRGKPRNKPVEEVRTKIHSSTTSVKLKPDDIPNQILRNLGLVIERGCRAQRTAVQTRSRYLPTISCTRAARDFS